MVNEPSGFCFIDLLFVTSGDQSRFSWMDLWLTHDQQSRYYYYERGDYQKAAEKFEDPLWKGLALSRAGDYEDALNAFALSDSAEAWYNQGNVLAHMGKYPDAVQAYQQALARRHPWPEAQENPCAHRITPSQDAK